MKSRRPGLVSIHLNTERGMRGGEVQCLGLVQGLAGAGHRCILAAPEGRPLFERARREGVEALAWSPRGEWDLGAALKLRTWIKASGARIVHAHTAHALTTALIAGRGLKDVKTVASRRVSFPLKSFLSVAKYKAADAVVAVSAEIAEGLALRGVALEKMHVIHSGVDLSRFQLMPAKDEARAALSLDGPGPVLGLVGALVEHKGHRMLFDVLPGLMERVPGLQVLLAGEGNLRAELEERARLAGWPVRFLGYVEDLPPVYAAMDCLVLPSLSGEGSPGAIKEAAAAGVPVVATDVGGAGEILRQEWEALLVAPGDAVGLETALFRVLSDGALAKRLAEEARDRVLAFSMERMAQAHAQLYFALTGRGPGTPS
jgi:glycosyltransferase involved in cell wall biosynthesis